MNKLELRFTFLLFTVLELNRLEKQVKSVGPFQTNRQKIVLWIAEEGNQFSDLLKSVCSLVLLTNNVSTAYKEMSDISDYSKNIPSNFCLIQP